MKYIREYCSENLNEIVHLLEQIDNNIYQQPIRNLSGATLGQHVRHIVEFYVCLLKGIDGKNINYDQRERNLLLETDTGSCINTILEIRLNLSKTEDSTLQLEGNFGQTKDGSVVVQTSVLRELAYCLEHSIHHQALLKVALFELGKADLIDANFGVAPATIRYKEAEQAC